MISIFHRVMGGSSLRQDAAFTLLTNVILGLVGIVTGVAAARILDVTARGQWAALQGWPMLFSGASMLGLQEAAVYLGARDRHHIGAAVGTATTLILLFGVFFATVGWFTLPCLLRAQGPSIARLGRFFLLYILLFALSGITLCSFRASQRISMWNAVRLAGPLPWVMVLIYSASTGVRSIPHLSILFLSLSCVITLAVLAVVYHQIPQPITVDPQLCRPLISYGMPVFLSTLPQYFNARLDQLLMSSLLPAEILGIYAIAVTWSGIMTPLTSAIPSLLLPRLSGINSHKRQQHLLARCVRVNLFLSLAGASIIAVITPFILPRLFGISYVTAVKPAYILIAAAVFLSLNGLLEEALKGLGFPNIALKAECFGLLFTVLFLSLFLRSYQTIGAAVASLLAYAFTTVYLSLQIYRQVFQIQGLHTDASTIALHEGDPGAKE